MTKDTLLGIFINVIFVLSIFSIRYYHAKKEMSILVDESTRQEEIIEVNGTAIDSLARITTKLQIVNDTQDKQIKRVSTDLYEIIRWSKEYEQRIQNLIDKVEEMKLELASVESSTIPFLQEFGTQDSYIKVFGRTGLRIKDNKIVDSKTIADFEGEITLGPPQIEKLDKYEFRAIYPDNEFLNLRIKGGQSEVIKLTPPRNQISIGPMLGVLYNTDTGLTTPTIGVGITYNMIKLWDWK
jgi:hypothetical protein